MANRRPLALVSGRTKELPDADGLLVGDATLDASGLTAPRTLTLPDASGTLLVNGRYDGGNASSVYTSAQHTFDGGDANG